MTAGITPEDPERRLFDQALDQTPGPERDAWLAHTCAGNPTLEARVRALLYAHEDDTAFLPDDDPNAPSAHAPSEKAGDLIGRYKLLQQIGEGGFGSVWMAEQTEPVSRRVAVKIIKLGMDTKEVIARFEAERQALAMMDHPNIAKVLDAGATDKGRPFFAMELVKGIPITQFCDEKQYGTRERLLLFGDVCSAINHAHQKGVIHRDIKPSNVMVTLHGDKAIAKVIDFGIAKATHGKLTEKTLFTRFEQFIGTPAYMSPEQAALSGLDIDTRSDIYALGIMLYELLTGKPPFDAKSLASAGYEEMRRIIREVEPPKPSSRLSTILGEERTSLAKARHIEPEKLSHLVEPDLDWIVMKAIEKDRARRYESASGLAQDIVRFLADEPVSALPPSAGYKFRKFARRNRVALRVGASIAVILVGTTAVSIWQAMRATDAKKLALGRLDEVVAERDQKEQARKDAEAISDFLVEVFESPDPDRDARTITVAETLETAARKLQTELLDQPYHRANLLNALGRAYNALGFPKAAIPLLKEVREFCLEAFGPDDRRSLGVAQDLAISYSGTGLVKEALALGEESLARCRRVLGPEDRDTIEAMNNLTTYYIQTDRFDEALRIATEVAKLTEKVYGENDMLFLTALANLAGRLNAAGRESEALDLRERVLKKTEELLSPRHPDTLSAKASLALSCSDFGRHEEAEAMMEEVLNTRRDVLGPDHPDTIGTIASLGTIYQESRKWDLSLARREEALQLRVKTQGSRHPETLEGMINLANAYRLAGQAPKAIALLEGALPGMTEALGANYSSILIAECALSIAYFDDARRDKALQMQEDLLPRFQAVFGPNDPSTLRVRALMASSWGAAGKKQEAAELCRKIVALQRDAIGKEEPDALDFLGSLGRAQDDAGLKADALATFESLVPLSTKILGPDAPETLESRMLLGPALREAGRLPEALEEETSLLAACKRVFGPEYRTTLGVMTNLAISLLVAHRAEEAIPLQEEALVIKRRVLAADDEYLRSAVQSLACCYHDTGRHVDELPLREEYLTLSRKTHGPADAITLVTMTELARAYEENGRSDAAVNLVTEEVEISRKVNGSEHPETLGAMNALGSTLSAAGEKERALEVREEILPLSRKVLGPEDRMTLGNATNLAMSYGECGRLDEAITLQETALEAKRRVLPADDPFTRTAIKNLAWLYGEKGRKADMFRLQADLLDFDRHAKGEEDPETINSMSNLSHALYEVGEFARGTKLRKEMLEARRKIRGPDHPETLGSYNTLARFQTAAGQMEEANATRTELREKLENLLSAAAAIQRDQLDLLQVRAENAVGSGRWKDAVVDLQRAVELDPTSWRYLTLAPVLIQIGDTAGYHALCRRVLESFSASADQADLERAGKICSLFPLEEVDRGSAWRLADEALRRGTADMGFLPWLLLARGWADYREERYSDAADALEKVVADGSKAAQATASAVLAMVYQRLQQPERATTALKAAATILGDAFSQPVGSPQLIPDQGEWRDWLIARVVCREASDFLDAKDPTTFNPVAR